MNGNKVGVKETALTMDMRKPNNITESPALTPKKRKKKKKHKQLDNIPEDESNTFCMTFRASDLNHKPEKSLHAVVNKQTQNGNINKEDSSTELEINNNNTDTNHAIIYDHSKLNIKASSAETDASKYSDRENIAEDKFGASSSKLQTSTEDAKSESNLNPDHDVVSIVSHVSAKRNNSRASNVS